MTRQLIAAPGASELEGAKVMVLPLAVALVAPEAETNDCSAGSLATIRMLLSAAEPWLVTVMT